MAARGPFGFVAQLGRRAVGQADDDGQAVGDDVVHLAGDPGALGDGASWACWSRSISSGRPARSAAPGGPAGPGRMAPRSRAQRRPWPERTTRERIQLPPSSSGQLARITPDLEDHARGQRGTEGALEGNGEKGDQQRHVGHHRLGDQPLHQGTTATTPEHGDRVAPPPYQGNDRGRRRRPRPPRRRSCAIGQGR